MKTINFSAEPNPIIRYGRVKPFRNKCAVTGELEWCNVEVSYIPDGKVLDIVSYREFINGVTGGGMLIEDICSKIYNQIENDIKPSMLNVRVYLEGNPNLSDWSVEMKSE